MGRTCRSCRGWSCLILIIVLVVPAVAQTVRLPHAGHVGDFFGAAVTIDGNLAVVGAPSEDECGENSGAAYIFERDTDTNLWHRSARLTEPECRDGSLFGRSVAMTRETVFVASGGEFFAHDRGASVHVFTREGESWTHSAELRSPTSGDSGLFATTIDASDGRLLVLTSGDHREGGFHGTGLLFEQVPDLGWSMTREIRPAIMPTQAVYGREGAISGDHIIIGAQGRGPRSGQVYIFEHDPGSGQWHQRAMKRGLGTGNLRVAIHGSVALAGDHGYSRGAGAVHMYRREADGAWTSLPKLRPVVSRQAGAFGSAVAVSDARALVVGFDEQLDVRTNIDRVVFVFQPDGRGAWVQRSVIDVGEVSFGASLDFDGDYAIVGNVGDEIEGAAYVVRIH